MKIGEILTEAWSQKYKNSINCSHPKGFSQRAHCAGKKKHNESVEMEMVCEDCGMCETHGNITEIKKGAKDSNGFTKCWPGKHAEGTKKGKNGGQVRNCVPNESQGVAEGFSNDMSTADMIAYLRQHHDTNLHQDYLDHINTFSKFVLRNIPVNSIKTDLPALDRAKVEQYKQMDFSKAPPIVIGGGYILDGYHRANVAKALGIPTIKAYVGVQGKPGVAEGSDNRCQQCGMTNCSCKPGTCKCKPVEGWIPNKGFKKAMEESSLEEQFDMIEAMVEAFAQHHGVDAEEIWEDFESVDDVELLDESAAWRNKSGKNKNGGLNAKGVASYRRENPGSKLQTAVTTKPSKLKPGSKAAKRRKSFCARMGGVKGPMKKPNGKPTRKALALRKWNC